jgi:uncharacterized membrane protein YeaQ/YmgE (transglycosylase-associated protein family)
MITAVLSWMLFGSIVGLISRLVAAGRQSMSLILTLVLGVLGAVAGGFLYSLLLGSASGPLSLSGSAWHGWRAILGAVFVLGGYTVLYPRRLRGQKSLCRSRDNAADANRKRSKRPLGVR